jgi:hypothetical protein
MRLLAPQAGSERTVSPGTPRGPVAVASVAAPEPVRIVRLDIDHMAKKGEEFEKRGKLGVSSFKVELGDDVTIDAELSEPAYCFLIAFRADGQDEVFVPDNPEARPGKTRNPSYPPESKPDLVYRLAEGSGLCAFAVVVSRTPLPPYRDWKARRGSPPWQKGLSAAPGVVWWYDCHRLPALTEDDRDSQRGHGATVRGCGTAVAELAVWLKEDPGVDAVAIKAFAVSPASGP